MELRGHHCNPRKPTSPTLTPFSGDRLAAHAAKERAAPKRSFDRGRLVRPSQTPSPRLHWRTRSWGARQDNIPRGRTIPMGAVPVLARGLGHTAPTYSRRRPGSPSNGCLGSALFNVWRSRDSDRMTFDAGLDPKALLRAEALARRGTSTPAARGRLRRAARRRRPAARAPVAAERRFPPSIRFATSRTRSPLLAGACRRTALRPRCPSPSARGRRLCSGFGGRATRPSPGAMAIPEPLAARARPSSRTCLFVPLAAFDRRGHRIGYGAGYYDRTLANLRAQRPSARSASPMAVSEIAAVPYEPHDQPLDFILTDRNHRSAKDTLMRLLFVGDVVGRSGPRAARSSACRRSRALAARFRRRQRRERRRRLRHHRGDLRGLFRRRRRRDHARQPRLRPERGARVHRARSRA